MTGRVRVALQQRQVFLRDDRAGHVPARVDHHEFHLVRKLGAALVGHVLADHRPGLEGDLAVVDDPGREIGAGSPRRSRAPRSMFIQRSRSIATTTDFSRSCGATLISSIVACARDAIGGQAVEILELLHRALQRVRRNRAMRSGAESPSRTSRSRNSTTCGPGLAGREAAGRNRRRPSHPAAIRSSASFLAQKHRIFGRVGRQGAQEGCGIGLSEAFQSVPSGHAAGPRARCPHRPLRASARRSGYRAHSPGRRASWRPRSGPGRVRSARRRNAAASAAPS